MHEVIKQLLPENVLLFTWVEHDEAAIVGPFRFPPEAPIPVAPESNEIMHVNWFNLPFEGREPVESLPDEELHRIDSEKLLRQVVEGAVEPASADGVELIDHLARCFLFFIFLAPNHPRYSTVREVFERLDNPKPVYENLVRLAKHYANEGIAFSEREQPLEALQSMLFAQVFYNGALALSPTTPGVQYEMGVLCYDMAERFSLPGNDDVEWERTLVNEARHYLQLALADPQLKDQSPGFYILGVCREALEDREGAINAYKLFLRSKAARQFAPFAEHASRRLAEISETGTE